MNKKTRSLKSLTEGVDEIINQVQEDTSIANALSSDKKFYKKFSSLLSDLNKLIAEKEETRHRYSQISLF